MLHSVDVQVSQVCSCTAKKTFSKDWIFANTTREKDSLKQKRLIERTPSPSNLSEWETTYLLSINSSFWNRLKTMVSSTFCFITSQAIDVSTRFWKVILHVERQICFSFPNAIRIRNEMEAWFLMIFVLYVWLAQLIRTVHVVKYVLFTKICLLTCSSWTTILVIAFIRKEMTFWRSACFPWICQTKSKYSSAMSTIIRRIHGRDFGKNSRNFCANIWSKNAEINTSSKMRCLSWETLTSMLMTTITFMWRKCETSWAFHFFMFKQQRIVILQLIGVWPM